MDDEQGMAEVIRLVVSNEHVLEHEQYCEHCKRTRLIIIQVLELLGVIGVS